jgi:L-alanine-DL-glutamate epimerase-like enolase superfamily enzyme
MQEMVRAYYFGWYDELVSGQPHFEAGRLRATDAPGHGVTIRDEVRSWDDLEVRTSPIGV